MDAFTLQSLRDNEGASVPKSARTVSGKGRGHGQGSNSGRKVKDLHAGTPSPSVPTTDARGQEHGSKYQDFLIAQAKLTLATAEQVRVLTSCTMMAVLLIDDEGKFSTPIRSSTKQWSEQVKASKADIGPPAVWAYRALCLAAVENAQDEDSKRIIQEFLDDAQGTVTKWVAVVSSCRIKSAWAKGQDKLQFSTSDAHAPVRDAIMRVLTECGHQVKHGVAPRSGLERSVQRFVDDWTK